MLTPRPGLVQARHGKGGRATIAQSGAGRPDTRGVRGRMDRVGEAV